MKIGVTGGSGFLGKYVVDFINSNRGTAYIITRQKSQNEFMIQTDYSIDDLSMKLKGLDAIIHLASERNPVKEISGYHASEIITQNIYEACLINNITNVVFASTISVYGMEKDLPWSENQLPTANTMYGISKYATELIGNKYNRTYGMKIKNLRLAHLFGFNEKNNYMINLFMRQAFNKKKLKLTTSSLAKREFLYAKDAAKAIFIALQYSEAGTFNIGNSNNVLSNKEVALYINEVFQNANNISIINPDSLDNTESSFMNNSKSELKLNFTAEYSFKEALQEIYEEMKELDDVPDFI